MKQKGMVYQSCIRSAMSYGSETWCLRENEMAILRRTERAMVRAMCGAKLMENVISDSQACELGRNISMAQEQKSLGMIGVRHDL